MSSAATIQASIDSIDEEIGKLTEARQTLTDLLGDEENGASEKPARSTRRRERVKDEDEKPARSRSTRATNKRDKERKASSKSNGKGDKPSRKEEIEGMLNDGMSAREIADELGIATNYVYNVKRAMA